MTSHSLGGATAPITGATAIFESDSRLIRESPFASRIQRFIQRLDDIDEGAIYAIATTRGNVYEIRRTAIGAIAWRNNDHPDREILGISEGQPPQTRYDGYLSYDVQPADGQPHRGGTELADIQAVALLKTE